MGISHIELGTISLQSLTFLIPLTELHIYSASSEIRCLSLGFTQGLNFPLAGKKREKTKSLKC